MRKFKGGAFRDDNTNKINFLSYLTTPRLVRYGAYMKKNEKKYGRANYRKGMPIFEVWESAFRHFTALQILDLHGKDSDEWKEWVKLNEELGNPVDPDEDHASALEFFLEARLYSPDKYD